MPNSLRKRVKKMAYKGEITIEEAERIRLALEKQIPMKPSDEMTGGLMCDKCFNCTVTEDMYFCSNCGQAIDWSK